MDINAHKAATAKLSVLDRPLHILHLEDSADDRRVVHQWLQEQNIAAEFVDVDNEAAFIKAFESETFDIVLSDKSLPGFDGLTALRFVRERFPHVPFVFVTGSLGEEAAIETIKMGATDYVLKDRLSRLIPAVQRAIRESEQEEKSRQIEEKNRQQAALLDEAQDAIVVTEVAGEILFWNKSAERIYGWPASAAIGRKAEDILSADPVRHQEAKQILLEKGSWTGQLAKTSHGGNELIVESRWTLVRDELGNPKSILIIDTDITEKKALEARFLRSQRMDSIGALAGGIAHDLNNALAPVIMGTEILRGSLDESTRNNFLDIISSSARRATDLVKQILSFARGSRGQRGPIKLKHLVDEMGKMIHDTFPKSILFSHIPPAKELWTVYGDHTELQQVLLNLCVNARDAMPEEGGRLTVFAQNVVLEDAAVAPYAAAPGRYVMISVADTGSGIPPKILPRIFEPFFTTKDGDKGTGLGLSTVAEIVKHHGGFIGLTSEPGQGTDFKVYLPALDSVQIEQVGPKEVVLPTGRGELVLIIDDEESVRELAKTTLESYGYRVVTAQNGLQGIARFKDAQHEIKLVVTDTDMPHMDGSGAIRAIKELNPDIPVVIASGHKKGGASSNRSDPVDRRLLAKPYSIEQLLVAVSLGLKR